MHHITMKSFRSRGFLFVLLLTIQSLAQQSESLFPVTVNGKVGYINNRGKLMIPPQFLDATAFEGSFARVAINDRWGFIDRSGKLVIPARFDVARRFSDGLAAVMVGDKYGFINLDGELVIEPKYKEVGDFSDGLAAVSVYSPDGFIHPRTKTRFSSLWTYIDKSGKQLMSPQLIYGFPFHNGVARFWTGSFASIDKYGLIDKSGHEIIEPIFDNIVSDFSEGVAPFRIGNKWGFTDDTGRIVIDPHFDSARGFSEGLGRIAMRNKFGVLLWGYIDHSGKIVIEPEFADNCDFSEGLACVAKFESKGWMRGYIDKTGKFAIKPTFDGTDNFTDGVAQVSIRTGKKFIDSHGQPIELVKSGYIDKTGTYVWKPTN